MPTATFDYTPTTIHSTSWEETLGLRVASRLEIIAELRKGLPAAAFERFSERTGLPREELARVVSISTRTVSRRKEKGEPLDPATSERLVRLARLYGKASDVTGDEELARQWMRTPRSALEGKTPLDMAVTELGAREVEDVLLRVEHGVFY